MTETAVYAEQSRFQGTLPGLYRLCHVLTKSGASDLHLVAGQRPHWRRLRTFAPVEDLRPPTPEEVEQFVKYILSPDEYALLQTQRDLDVAFAPPERAGYRFRVNVRYQAETLAVSIRALPPVPDSPEAVGLPPSVIRLSARPRGLILVTGPTGSGKSTTLAALIQHLNSTRACHIITIEDPVEYVFPTGRALIEQRQVGRDASTFEAALRAVLRQDPDVVMIGELRSPDTIRAAAHMAEAGHLTLATSHAPTAVDALTRLISMIPEHAQDHLRTQLASVLEGIIAQQLLPHKSQRQLVLAAEVFLNTAAAQNLILEKKLQQLNSYLDTTPGGQSMTAALRSLVKAGAISRETALAYAPAPDQLKL